MRGLFCYGTLEFPRVMELLAGRSLPGEPAWLHGYARRRMRGVPWPGIVPAPGGMVHGTLYTRLAPAELRILDDYEGEAYRRRALRIHTAAGERGAWVYVVDDPALMAGNADWDRAAFARDHLQEYLREMEHELFDPRP